MNDIPQKQNFHNQLEKLAAQRQLYSDAKALQFISVLITIPLAIIWSIVIVFFPGMTVYAGLWAIIASLLESLVFANIQKSLQEKAAKIQQLFDCEVLQFNWLNLNCGVRVEPETIIDAANKFKRKDPNYVSLIDWYPQVVSQLSIDQARIICQRSNIWWDAQLRRRYNKLIIAILFILTVIVFLISIIGGLTLEKFLLAFIAPLAPAYVFGLRQYSEHKEAANRLDKLREDAEALLQELKNGKLTPQDLERESYTLQTQIYDHRRRSPLILDRLYSHLRRKNEEQMNKGAEVLIEEFKRNP
ncbi:S-4TM family putative pore-forming effector [Aulosira sp. FACHB-615]|uniref:S-4TM family putative pore-forming effector n=1 Tax=Aulosira sp. FACHB-615 TaxID=2692777 RepID=UPI001682A8B1|nr:S-4TM family putative pore-forming effector [Aulosira sp. FACHB-615]MBD2491979.1 hypothetical protein [Aulosira sp. FACHB-615]